MSNLTSSNGDVNEIDFIDRANLLCSLGLTVIITNFKEYYNLNRLYNFLSNFKNLRA